MENEKMEKLAYLISAFWDVNKPEDYSAAARAIIRNKEDIFQAAQEEREQEKELSEETKRNLRFILQVTKSCERQARLDGKKDTAARLIAIKWDILSKFKVKDCISVPLIHPQASKKFCSAVVESVSKLPLDVQRVIGDKAFFVELSPDGIRALTTNDDDGRRVVCISAGIDSRELLRTIAHECGHVFKNHKDGSSKSETEANELLKQWGFDE